MDKDFLLESYGECYGPEAGPWNLSLTNKYLEYMITKFFEENFVIQEKAKVCNIGIGAGYWDRYLSYKLNGGSLTSIDIDEECCRQLRECLENEKNTNPVEIIQSDVTLIDYKDCCFDIITMIGSTRIESGLYEQIIVKAFDMLKAGGSLYYQTLDRNETKEDFEQVCFENNVSVEIYWVDEEYGYRAQYWKVVKNNERQFFRATRGCKNSNQTW